MKPSLFCVLLEFFILAPCEYSPPLVSIKLKWRQVWGRMFFCESQRVQFRCFHHIFPAIRRKVSRFSLKHDAEGWEQLYTLCIWLRKTVPFSVCSCDDQYLSYPFSFSDSWGSVHGGFAKESKRVCGFADICHSASVTLFHQSELDSTKPSSILTWSQKDFFSFPFSLDLSSLL